MLVATPGRLVDLIERARVSLSAVKYFILDEAGIFFFLLFILTA